MQFFPLAAFFADNSDSVQYNQIDVVDDVEYIVSGTVTVNSAAQGMATDMLDAPKINAFS